MIRFVGALLINVGLCFAAGSVVQEKACNSAGAAVASVGCTFDSTPTAANLIHASCIFYNFNDVIVSTLTDNKSNSYSAGPVVKNASDTSVAHHYSANISSSATFTVTCAVDSNTYVVLHIYELAGLATSSPLDRSGTNAVDSGSTSATVSTSAATTQADELSIATVGFQTATAPNTAGSGYTLLRSTENAGTTVMGATDEYKVLSATGTETATLTFGTSQAAGYSAVISTYKASGGGGGPAPPSRRRAIN